MYHIITSIMPLINDSGVYALADFVDGCTVIGSDATGKTVQFSLSAVLNAARLNTDVIHYANASAIGQTCVGNADPLDLDSPDINGGKKWIGVLLSYPVVTDDDVDFIYQNI